MRIQEDDATTTGTRAEGGGGEDRGGWGTSVDTFCGYRRGYICGYFWKRFAALPQIPAEPQRRRHDDGGATATRRHNDGGTTTARRRLHDGGTTAARRRHDDDTTTAQHDGGTTTARRRHDDDTTRTTQRHSCCGGGKTTPKQPALVLRAVRVRKEAAKSEDSGEDRGER